MGCRASAIRARTLTLLITALFGAMLPLAAEAAAAKSVAAAPAVPASAASAPTSRSTLAAIVEGSAGQDAFEAAVRHHLPGQARIDALAAEVDAQQAAFTALGAPLADGQGELAEHARRLLTPR